MKTISMLKIDIAELGKFWILLEILDLKKSISMIAILFLDVENNFGSTPFGERSDYIALMAG